MSRPCRTGATSPSRDATGGPAGQRGVVTIEFALMLMLGLLPLLLLTFSGAMIFAAKQSLSLAAAEGARATLHYGSDAQRQASAHAAAVRSMQWLLGFAGNSNAAGIEVSGPIACEAGSGTYCYTVTTSYRYDEKPFLPGTAALYGWVMGASLKDAATAQLDAESARQLGLR